MVLVEGGAHEIGAAEEGFAYDNERPRHPVELEAFWIDRTPVTNGAFARVPGRDGAEPPMYWERDGEGGWVRTAMGQTEAVDPALPGDPRLLGPGRRLRALGGQAAPDRARVGGRRRRRRPRPRQPRPARLRHARRRAPTPTPPASAARCRCSATSGSGPRVTSSPTRVSGLSLPRVLRGLLRRHLQGPARRSVGDAGEA